MKKPIDPRIVEYLAYDPVTGLFTWRNDAPIPKNRLACCSGKVAGEIANNGYINITATVYGARVRISASRLAWFMHYGEDPGIDDIDHKDRDRSNNAIDNLRRCSHTLNCLNMPVKKASVSGIKGVGRYREGRWRAKIRIKGRMTHLGYFDTAEEASQAYQAAAAAYAGEFAYRSH